MFDHTIILTKQSTCTHFSFASGVFLSFFPSHIIMYIRVYTMLFTMYLVESLPRPHPPPLSPRMQRIMADLSKLV